MKPIKVEIIEMESKNVTESDIVLLKVENKLDYTQVMPICLPHSSFVKEEEANVWISGYNFYYNRKIPASKKYEPLNENIKTFLRLLDVVLSADPVKINFVSSHSCRNSKITHQNTRPV